MNRKEKLLTNVLFALIIAMFIVLLNPVMSLDSYAEDLTDATGNFKYTLDGNKATIKKYVGEGGNVDIPSTMDGYTVVCIYNNAFENKTDVTSISIPNTVTKIGHKAFMNSGLTSLTLPEGLTNLGEEILRGVEGVKEITIPKSLEYIGTADKLGPFGASYVENITIEYGAKVILDNLFSNCTTLKNVYIPDSVTIIGSFAFYNCKSLTYINIPDKVTHIGAKAFSESGLTSLSLPSSIEYLYDQILLGNEGVKEIVVPKNLYRALIGSSDLGPFAGSAIKKVVFEEGTKKVLENICSKCTSLMIAKIPATVTEIQKNAFNGCTKLHSITIPQSVKDIHKDAFKNCSNLMVYCNYYSNSTPLLVERGFSFDESDEPFINGAGMPIEHYASGFYAERKASGIKVTLDLKYNEELAGTKAKTVSIWIPDGFDVNFDTLMLNDEKCDDYTFTDNLLEIPVNESESGISFYVDEGEFTQFVSFAKFTYGSQMQTIGTINMVPDIITLSVDDVVSEKYIEISGTTYPRAAIGISVNDLPYAIGAGDDGNYYKKIEINPESDYELFTIEVSVDNKEKGIEIVKSANVLYDKNGVTVDSLTASYNDKGLEKTTDIYHYDSTDSVLPVIHFDENNGLKFTSKYNDSITGVHVTSTKNRETRLLSSKGDESCETFISNGFFENNYKSYLPGRIGVNYLNPGVVNEVNSSYSNDDLSKLVEDAAKGTDNKYVIRGIDCDENHIEGLIQWPDDNCLNGYHYVKVDVYLIENSECSIYRSSMGGATTLIDNSDYKSKSVYNIISGSDFSEEKMDLFIYPCGDTAIFSGKAVYAVVDFAYLNDFKEKDQYADAIEYFAKFIDSETDISSTIYKKNGIYSNYHRLMRNIEYSDIVDKEEAYKDALKLNNEMKAFSVLCGTLFPILQNINNDYQINSDCAYKYIYSVLLNVLTNSSNELWYKGLSNFNGRDAGINWFEEPCGYIYDALTKEPIEGVSVSAYYIPYDGTVDFFNKTPASTEYGELWLSGWYNQMNPIITDSTGEYAWDMPKGWYRIKCEKDEYRTYWSDWMSVNPLPVNSNIILKPVNMPPEIYEIEYVLNGGVNAFENPVTYTEGVGVKSLYAPKRDGFIFEGWFKEQTFVNKVTSIGSDSVGKVTLYAKWRPDKDSVDTITIKKASYRVTVSSMGVAKSAEFIKTTDKSKTISVPGSIAYKGQNVKVTSIADNAFKNNKTMTTVSIGKGIAIIGKNSFNGCTKLKTIKGVSSITEIKSGAFSGCKVLSKIPSMNLLIGIGDKAFYNCNAITKFTIGSKVTKIGKSAFQNCRKLKSLTIKTTKLTSKNVGSDAFKSIGSSATIKVPSKKLKDYKTLLKKKGIKGKKQKIKK